MQPGVPTQSFLCLPDSHWSAALKPKLKSEREAATIRENVQTIDSSMEQTPFVTIRAGKLHSLQFIFIHINTDTFYFSNPTLIQKKSSQGRLETQL